LSRNGKRGQLAPFSFGAVKGEGQEVKSKACDEHGKKTVSVKCKKWGQDFNQGNIEKVVTPAKAGVHAVDVLDSGIRRNDVSRSVNGVQRGKAD